MTTEMILMNKEAPDTGISQPHEYNLEKKIKLLKCQHWWFRTKNVFFSKQTTRVSDWFCGC